MEVHELGGEFALIERIAEKVRTSADDLLVGIGDDAAVLGVGEHERCVVTTDMILEDVHFRLRWTDAYRLGWKAVAINLSDVAAMAARPTFTFVSIALPATIPVSFIEELYRGMHDVCARFGSVIAGGDTNVSPDRVVINVTQIGVARKRHIVLRSDARPGDLIFVTGALGEAAAGLALLEAEGLTEAERIAPAAVERQLRPTPRVHEARAARRGGGVTAMMDISDGLLDDLGKLCRASGVGARVRAADVPVGAAAHSAGEHLGADPLLWAVNGGEDYELLIAVSPERAGVVRAHVEAATGTPLTEVGAITAEPEILLLRPDGSSAPVHRGWDHFDPPAQGAQAHR